ncbi:hypothetical protein J7E70_07760 [Variovorax paradoxus]|nr:hypothetical protein [Variovorax paradoxus]MBT2300358.1 hypothetical protein [Variovorax paradoxus]
MPTFEFTAPDGKTYEVQGPDGATQEQAFSMLQSQIAGGSAPATKEPSAAFSAGRAVNDIPRQLGLTARYGLEGLANTAQIVTEPARYLTDRLTGMTGRTKPLGAMATQLADSIGLPSPQTPNERVIGDASRLVAGAGGMAGAAGAASKLPGAVGSVMEGLAANPMAQITSAAGAGLAGGASREAGGTPLAQAGAALIGGVAGGLAPGGVQTVVDAGKRLLAPKLTPQQIDLQLTSVLGQAGADYSQLPMNVRNSLRKELASSLQAGKELDPAAVSRLADFMAVGATPTRGMVSQNPVQITREMNLAKMAANSGDDALHGLPLLQNQNNATLIRNLNERGAGTETLPIVAGRAIQDRIQGTNAALGSVEQGAWNLAKNSPGYKAPIYPDGLNAALQRTGDEALTGYLPKQVTDYMAAFQTGQQPFTPQHYKNLRSMLSAELAKGGSEAAAARAAIEGLESVPMRPITNPGGIDFGTAPVTQGMASAMRGRDAQAGDAIEAVNRARQATAAKYAYQESSPLVRTALADARTADPEKLAQSFVLNGTVNDARSVAREVGPEGIATIRNTLATYIKKQALSGASDETGKVSQSALNAVLRKIGDEKLRLFFTPDEVSALQATGRVASLMQAQPIGSAVNNSNSGALVLGRGMDMLNGVAGKIPFGKAAVIDPLRSINLSISQRQAENVLPGLLAEQPRRPLAPSLLLPGIAVGGGLLSQ